jgi:hypothetical protein
MSITITEALAEIKTIGKRLEKKRAAVLANLARDSRVFDPLEGGSVEFVKRERQGIADLEKRIVDIRTAIQKSNLTTSTTVGEQTMTIAEWLTFRREVSKGRKDFLTTINGTITGLRQKFQQQGGRAVLASATAIIENSKPDVPTVLIHLDERTLLEEQENLEKALGDLDGKLSLLNATTTIEL